MAKKEEVESKRMKRNNEKENRRKPVGSSSQNLTYSSVGVNRNARHISRRIITEMLERKYEESNPVKLPFGSVFFSSPKSELFLDFQIEGVGTKTLLAEVEPKIYETIGIDAVAMAANDIIRSGARPAFLADALHIAESKSRIINWIISGLLKGAEMCGAILASGETGDVPELLHKRIGPPSSEPFDLFVSCVGFGKKSDLIMGGINEGDPIIGIESSGVHSNGLSLARRVLFKTWGGRYDFDSEAEGLSRPILDELSIPTRIYAKAINSLSGLVPIKAAIHITGDSFAKFNRLSEFNASIPNSPSGKRRLGFEFEELGAVKPMFRLIFETAKASSTPILPSEMYRTFNMGYGFGLIVAPMNLDRALSLLNKYYPSRRIGRVTHRGRVEIKESRYFKERLVL